MWSKYISALENHFKKKFWEHDGGRNWFYLGEDWRNFFYLGEDRSQFFPNLIIVFYEKSQNLGEDQSSDSHQFRPHCLTKLADFRPISSWIYGLVENLIKRYILFFGKTPQNSSFLVYWLCHFCRFCRGKCVPICRLPRQRKLAAKRHV